MKSTQAKTKLPGAVLQIPAMMKAIRTHGRAGPEQLVFENVPVPKLAPGDALIQVFATGITPMELTWSETYENADGTSRTPSVPGHEVSGIVADLASGVTGLRIGDAVYGLTDFNRDGAAAEYAAVRASNLAPKPRSLDHPRAAAVPLSALTAWQALFQHGRLSRGQRVLIHGGAGGVGTFAVQLAHWRGAYVVATASRQDAQFVSQLGADQVIDYKEERFEGKAHDIDLVLDTIGGETRDRSWHVMRPGGILVSLTDPIPNDKPAEFEGVFFIVLPSRENLTALARLVDAGSLKSVVAEVLPLERAREAFEHGLTGHHRGKIVIEVHS